MNYTSLALVAFTVLFYLVSIRYIGGPIARAIWRRWCRKDSKGWSRLFFPFASGSDSCVGYDEVDRDGSMPLVHFHRLHTTGNHESDAMQKYVTFAATLWLPRLALCFVGLAIVGLLYLTFSIVSGLRFLLGGIGEMILRGLHWLAGSSV